VQGQAAGSVEVAPRCRGHTVTLARTRSRMPVSRGDRRAGGLEIFCGELGKDPPLQATIGAVG
jgi:hypothetical protein